MIDDPWFYVIAVPVIVLVGVSKGGFAGGLAVLGVPLLSFVVSPATAAAVLLPILVAMDVFAVAGYRKRFDPGNLRVIMPAALLGVAAGYFSYELLSEDHIKLLVGVVSLIFAVNWFRHRWLGRAVPARKPGTLRGSFFGALAGFTSFSVHAGGPPIDMYLLPQKMNKTVLVGTTVIFFAFVNFIKLVPYGALGLLSADNLRTSLALIWLAPVGIRLGMYLHKRISENGFYLFCYGLLFLTGLKLSVEGLAGVIQG
ncbi:sulfite exporter TauE/SafE family protein [Granulosicoccaceae sp. 1_MG-2023]|nr:sulfite exporter TauE/SafE family protein [Granulosicoccaceae sp. 1_MG-2023]